MGNSGWTADPDSLLIPPDASLTEARIYVGPDDPLALGQSQDAAIMFYFGPQSAIMMSVEADINNEYGDWNLWGLTDDTAAGLAQFIDITYQIGPVLPEYAGITIGGQVDSTFIDSRGSSWLQSDGTVHVTAGDFLYINAVDIPITGDVDVTGDMATYGTSMPRGFVANAVALTNAPTSTGADVVQQSVTATFKAGRAFRVTFGTAAESSVAGDRVKFVLHYDNELGATIAQPGDVELNGTAGDNKCDGVIFLRNNTASNMTRTLALTLRRTAGTGACGMVGYASAPRYMIVEDIGAASQYTAAIALV